VGSGFEPHWRPQPAKLPSFGGYSLETLPYRFKVLPPSEPWRDRRIKPIYWQVRYLTPN